MHSMSGYIPTIGNSGLMVQNVVRTGQQSSGLLGTWSGHLVWDNPGSARFTHSEYYGNGYRDIYFLPTGVSANFTSTGNAQPEFQHGYNIWPYSNPQYPSSDRMYNYYWDMKDPNSKFDIYRLEPTSFTAYYTANTFATVVFETMEYEAQHSVRQSAELMIGSNSIFYGYSGGKGHGGAAFMPSSTGVVTSAYAYHMYFRQKAGTKFITPGIAGSPAWTATAYRFLDPTWHTVTPEMESCYTLLTVYAQGNISRIPMPSAYK